MKTIRLIIIILLTAGTYTNVKCQNTNDKIKSIIVTEEKDDAMVKKQYKESETYYDQRGNVTESITYKLGKVNKHFKYEYDSDNNKIKEEEYDASGKLKEYSEYKYSNGLRTEKLVYDPNKKMKSRKVYNYTKY